MAVYPLEEELIRHTAPAPRRSRGCFHSTPSSGGEVLVVANHQGRCGRAPRTSCQRRLLEHASADDLTQDVFLSVFVFERRSPIRESLSVCLYLQGRAARYMTRLEIVSVWLLHAAFAAALKTCHPMPTFRHCVRHALWFARNAMLDAHRAKSMPCGETCLVVRHAQINTVHIRDTITFRPSGRNM